MHFPLLNSKKQFVIFFILASRGANSLKSILSIFQIITFSFSLVNLKLLVLALEQ